MDGRRPRHPRPQDCTTDMTPRGPDLAARRIPWGEIDWGRGHVLVGSGAVNGLRAGPHRHRRPLLSTGRNTYTVVSTRPARRRLLVDQRSYDIPATIPDANPIDRYSIGDRTAGIHTADDGVLTVTIRTPHPRPIADGERGTGPHRTVQARPAPPRPRRHDPGRLHLPVPTARDMAGTRPPRTTPGYRR